MKKIIILCFILTQNLMAQTVLWSEVISNRTTIKASHIMELRTQLNLKQACMLVSLVGFTDSVLTKETPIKAVHIQELRKKIDSLGAFWVVSDWSACSGGSGAWAYGGWGTCSGGATSYSYASWSTCSKNCDGGTQTRTATCQYATNSGTQNRSATCVLNPDSGTQSRTVSCMAGAIKLPDAKCSTAKPATNQFCTPTNTALCGAVGTTTQACTPTGPASCSGTPTTTQSCNTQSCCTNVRSCMACPPPPNDPYCSGLCMYDCNCEYYLSCMNP